MNTGETPPAPSRSEQIAAARAKLEVKKADVANVSSEEGVVAIKRSNSGTGAARSQFKNKVHRWSRLLHVYTSMLGLLAILYFATTGLLLNNPSWTLGSNGSTTTTEGVLPDGVASSDSIDYLAADQYFRSEEDVRGDVTDYCETAGQASINYKNPGYSAYAAFDAETGTYTITVTKTGLVSTLNDLHAGSSVGGAWKFLINVIAVGLVVIAISGLTMQFFLRKRRRSSLITAATAGIALVVTIVWVILG